MEEIEEVIVETCAYPGAFLEESSSSSDDVIFGGYCSPASQKNLLVEEDQTSSSKKKLQQPKPRHYCSLCPLSYQSIKMFNHHKHRKHPKFMKEIQKFTSYNYSKPKTYKCSVIGCNMVFENSAYVKDHMNIHKTLACFYCHSKFISQEKLDIHFRVCGVNSEFCCHICQVGFKTKAYLSNHQRLIHQVQKKIVIYPPSLNHNRHITIEDDACYEEHDESNQDIESVNEDYGDSTVKQEIEICYNCIECGNMYDEETEYRDHMITHTNS